MRKRTIQAEIVVLAGVLLLAAAAVGFYGRTTVEPDLSLSSPYGAVTWNHQFHARMPGMQCATCHHTERKGFTKPLACTACHQRLGNPEDTIVTHTDNRHLKSGPPSMMAYHASCIGCHKAKAKGPTSCRECHAEPFEAKKIEADKLSAEDGPVIARLGHLTREYEPVMFAHKAHIDYADNCITCHHHGSAVEATPSCRACHNTLEKAPDTGMQGLKDAYHQQCIGCHEKNGSGPGKDDCETCHAKLKPGEAMLAYNGPDTARLFQLHQVYDSVAFNHAVHVESVKDCLLCHHHQSPVDKTPACRECHNQPTTRKDDKKLGLIDAYHIQCITCHVTGAQGPTGCDQCHLKTPAVK